MGTTTSSVQRVVGAPVSNSVADSWFVDINGFDPLFMKWVVHTPDVSDDIAGVLYEIELMVNVIKPIVDGGSFQFLRCMGFACMHELLHLGEVLKAASFPTEVIDKVLKRSLWYQLTGLRKRPLIHDTSEELSEDMDNINLKNFKFSCVFIERVPETTHTLNTLYESHCDPTLLFRLVFQVLMTCLAMESIHMNHNDLHWNNVFVVRNSCDYLQYRMSNSNIYVPNMLWIAKVFDFDFAYCESLGKNKKLNSMKAYGLYNEFVPGRDIVKVLSPLYRRFENLRESILKSLLPCPCENVVVWHSILMSSYLKEPCGIAAQPARFKELLPSCVIVDNVAQTLNITFY